MRCQKSLYIPSVLVCFLFVCMFVVTGNRVLSKNSSDVKLDRS